MENARVGAPCVPCTGPQGRQAIARSVGAGKAITCESQEAREGRQGLAHIYRPAYAKPCARNKAKNSAPCRSFGPPARMTASTRALTDPAISYRSYRTEECGLRVITGTETKSIN
jgi:hypothetical protein